MLLLFPLGLFPLGLCPRRNRHTAMHRLCTLALLALAFALPGAETRARALALLRGWRLEESALVLSYT